MNTRIEERCDLFDHPNEVQSPSIEQTESLYNEAEYFVHTAKNTH